MKILSRKTFHTGFYATLIISGLLTLRLMLKKEIRFDDAYMFYRYAYNMLHGGTYGWNLHERTFGCTSIPYTFSIYLIQLAGAGKYLADYQMLALSSFFWGVLAIIFLYAALKLAVKDTVHENRILVQSVIMFTALSPLLLTNVMTGMDTSFSLFANTLIIYIVLKYPLAGLKNILLHAFFCYFAYLVRPDNGIYSTVFPLLYYVYKKYPRRQIITFTITLVAFFAIDTLVKAWYFGNPMPLPYYAKKGGFYEGFLGLTTANPIEFLFGFLINFGILLLPVLLLANKSSFKACLVFFVPLTLTVLYFFTVVQIMGMNSRYYIPSLPFLLSGVIIVLTATDYRTVSIKEINLIIAGGALAIFLFCNNFVLPSYLQYVSRKQEKTAAAFISKMPWFKKPSLTYTHNLLNMNAFIGKLPQDIVIAASEYGYISAKHPQMKILDLCGLHNKDLAISGWNDTVLDTERPDFIWLIHPDYTGLYYKITTGRNFKEQYQFFPGLFDYGIAIRKDSKYYSRMLEEVNRVL